MKGNLEKSRQNRFIITSLFIILFISVAVFSTIGTANVGVMDTLRIILSKLPFIGNKIDISNISKSHKNIIWNIRIPRVLLGILVGSGLSIAGAAFQGIFKNPMADPYVLGISSGAALGASLAIILKINFTVLGISSISVFAFIGGIITIFTVYNIAKVNNMIPMNNLLLSGVAVGQFLTAIMSLLMVLFDDDMKNIVYWTMGSLSGKGWYPIKNLSIPIILGIVIMNFFARDLNILLTGDEVAKSLGVDVEKTTTYIIILATLITALVVSISGTIGFVGLIIPHMVRIVLGPDHRIVLPASALVGGIFMVFTDTLARTLVSPMEIPVGIITSVFGGPFFIYLLRNKKRNL